MALSPVDFLKAIRSLDRLFALEEKHSKIIEAQAREIQHLKDRVTSLEAREAVLIAEAKGAAATAASTVAAQHMAELARHIGILDERTRRLPPPAG